jgi:hypothetical protein
VLTSHDTRLAALQDLRGNGCQGPKGEERQTFAKSAMVARKDGTEPV